MLVHLKLLDVLCLLGDQLLLLIQFVQVGEDAEKLESLHDFFDDFENRHAASYLELIYATSLEL